MRETSKFGYWARVASARGADLEGAQPDEHALLLDAVHELERAAFSDAESWQDSYRSRVAVLAGGVHAIASWLHKDRIRPYDAVPYAAAREIDQAALQILDEMNGDYGDLAQQLASLCAA